MDTSVALLEYIVKEPTSDIKQTPNDPWNDWVTNDVVTDYLAGKLLVFSCNLHLMTPFQK